MGLDHSGSQPFNYLIIIANLKLSFAMCEPLTVQEGNPTCKSVVARAPDEERE